MRATTFVMAALAGVRDWMLGRQHGADLLNSLGRLSSAKLSEITVKQ